MDEKQVQKRVEELIGKLETMKGGLRKLRKLAPSYKIKGASQMKKADLVVELASAIALQEYEAEMSTPAPSDPPEEEIEEVVEADPEEAPGYYSREDLVERVTPERLDSSATESKVYLRWDPQERHIRALKDGQLANPVLTIYCENVPPGCNYDKTAGYLAQMCGELGLEVAPDFTWEHEQHRVDEVFDEFRAMEPDVAERAPRVIYTDEDLEEGWDDDEGGVG